MHQTGLNPETEYTIYAYNSFQTEKIGHNKWTRLSSMQAESEALVKAERLFESRLYQKVEVKKKSFDQKSGRYIARTHKVYQIAPRKDVMTLLSVLLLAFASAGLFYLRMM